jgi:hypothetical protein
MIGLMLGVQPETAKAQSIVDRIKKAAEEAQKKGQQQQKAPQQTSQPNGTAAPAGQQTKAPQTSKQTAPNAQALAANAPLSTAKVDAQGEPDQGRLSVSGHRESRPSTSH